MKTDQMQRQMLLVSQELKEIHLALTKGADPEEFDLRVWNCYSVLEATMARLKLGLRLEEPGRTDSRPAHSTTFADLVQTALTRTLESQSFLQASSFHRALEAGREGRAHLREFLIRLRRTRRGKPAAADTIGPRGH